MIGRVDNIISYRRHDILEEGLVRVKEDLVIGHRGADGLLLPTSARPRQARNPLASAD